MPWKYCTVDIEFRAPDKRRRDVDNYLKALFDALTGSGFWLDDSQVVSMNVKLVEPGNKNSSYTIIKIEEKDGYDRPRDFGEETPSGVYNL